MKRLNVGSARLWRQVRAWFVRNVPSDERLAMDTKELREFHNRIEENRAIAQRRLAEIHNTTKSPIHRRSA